MYLRIIGFFTLFLVTYNIDTVKAQNAQNQTISVYIDCRTRCPESYIRDEINFVNFVRDQDDAQVHLLLDRQGAGSGGSEYTLTFIGGKESTGIDKTMSFFTAASDTENEQRERLIKYLKVGLMSYIGDHPVVENIFIIYDPIEMEAEPVIEDKWDNWVFEISADTDLEGEETESELNIEGQVTAERITPNWKTEFEIEQDYERRSFIDDDTSRVFTTQIRSADLYVIKSLSDHWSAGFSSTIRSSTRDNTQLLTNGSLAVEYSVFPYREFITREVTFRYRLTGGFYNYDEVTIYGKTEEFLMQHQFRANLEFTQPWGEFETDVNAYAYLHDFERNRLDTEMRLNFRIFRGFSIYISGEYAWIYDQLSIPAGEITDEEQLLDLRQRFTSYSYEVRVGLEFSFGSIFNNVVNPRL